jgi:hypothetical protein
MKAILKLKFSILNFRFLTLGSEFGIKNFAWAYFFGLWIAVSGLPSADADQQGGQRPAAYLQYGFGGPQEAMGGAAVGDRNDVACGFWNPAGLSGLRGLQVEAQDLLLPLNQQLYYLSVANGFQDKFFYGVTGAFYTPGGDLEARTGPTLQPDSLFSDTELTFLTSVAVRISPRWSFGGNVKIMTQNIGNFSGFGIGEDLGIQYRFSKHTTFGFVAQDPFTVFSYSNSNSQIFPATLKAGIAEHDENLSIKGNFDLEWSSDLGFRPRFGMEWRPAEVIAIRGGFWLGNLTSGASGGSLAFNPTCGIGIIVPMGDSLMEFDYTLMPDRIVSGNLLHQVSVTGKFL